MVRPKAKSAPYKWTHVVSSLAGAGPYVELSWSHHLHHPLAFALKFVAAYHWIDLNLIVVVITLFKGQKQFRGNLWVQVFAADWAVNEAVELLFLHQFLDVLFVHCVPSFAVEEAIVSRVSFLLASLIATFHLRFGSRTRLHLLIANSTISL